MTDTAAKNAIKAIASPYKLLDYYGFEDSGLFFGREAETRQMVGEILSTRLLVLYSPSGSGKTSLIQAGVRPQLEEMGVRTVYTRLEGEPVPSVIQAVRKAFELPEDPEPDSRDLYGFLNQAVLASGKPLVIFLDQFEEFFIFNPNRDLRREFIQHVARIKYDDELPVFLVLSLREDYLAHLHEFRASIPSIFQNNANIRLDAFDEKAGRRAMEKPLEKTGWSLAPDLADALVTDLNTDGGGIAPIKLQMVCGALWEKRPAQPGEIPLSAYKDLGGADAIISRFIAERLDQVPRGRYKLLIKVCEALKTPDNTKRFRSYEDLRTQLNIKNPKDLDAVLRQLVSLRVLRQEERGGSRWFEFAHDYVAAEMSQWIHDKKERTRRKQMKRWRIAVIPGILLFLAVFTYFFIEYNTFYAGFSTSYFEYEQEEIIISRGFSFSGQTISTGLFFSDVKGLEEKNKLREKLKISFWDQDNWLALADTLNDTESGKFLYQLGQKQSGIERLIRALNSSILFFGDWEAVDALVRLGKEDHLVIDALLQTLKENQFSEIREIAATVLGKIGKAEPEVIAALLQALQHEFPYIRGQAAESLGKLGKAEPEIIAALIQTLEDKSVYVQSQAAEALVRMKKADENVIIALILIYKNENADFQKKAAYLLTQIVKMDEKVLNNVLKNLRINDSDLQRISKFLVRLKKADKDVIDILNETLNDKDINLRILAADFLVNLGKVDEKIIMVLKQPLENNDPNVTLHAVNILRKIGKVDKKIVYILHKSLRYYNNPSTIIMVASSLGKLGIWNDNIYYVLEGALKEKDTWIRLQAAEVLGQHWQDKPEEELLHLLEDTRSEFRTIAAYALAAKKSLSPDTLQQINTMKDSAKHPWVRLGAWQAYELLQDKKEKSEKSENDDEEEE